MGSVSKPDILYIKSFQILCRIGISMLARSNRMERGVSDVTLTPGGGNFYQVKILHFWEYLENQNRYSYEIWSKCFYWPKKWIEKRNVKKNYLWRQQGAPKSKKLKKMLKIRSKHWNNLSWMVQNMIKTRFTTNMMKIWSRYTKLMNLLLSNEAPKL